jgi:arylsulfatase A-like enzyme
MVNPKSLILVTVDCLRADHVGFMGYQHPTTPVLDSVASESFIFPAAIVAGVPTYYSFPAILASRYPLSLGRDVLGISAKEPTLASVLNSQGYATAGFVAANPYVSSHFGYEQGFDTFKDFMGGELAPLSDGAAMATENWLSRLNQRIERGSKSLGSVGAVYDELYFQYCQRLASPRPESLTALRRFPAADVIVKEAMDWLSAVGSEKFFLWIHLMDPHSPYYPTEEALAMMGISGVTPFRARYLNSAWNRGDLTPKRLQRYREDVVKLYDAGVRWVDAQVGHLLDALRCSGQWGSCVFVLTGDHGEEFLDQDGRFHPPSRLREELIRVPLLMRVPEAPKREVTNSPFSLLHLAPTLLDALKIPAPAEFRGRSFWREVQDGAGWEDPAIVESVANCTNPFRRASRLGPRVLVVRESRYKLQLRLDPPSEGLFDLVKDPEEKSPLPIDAEKGVRRRLLERARSHLLGAKERDLELRLQMQLRDLRLEWNNQQATSQR